MLFNDLTKYGLYLFCVICLLQGLDFTFNLGYGTYLFVCFLMTLCFMLGAGFVRYNVDG